MRALLQRTAVRRSPRNGSLRPASGVGGRTTLAPVRPERAHGHAALGQRAGLVGADHVGGAERLDRRSRLTSARRRAMRRTPTASASVIVGQQALGHVGDQQADRERERVVERQARRRACRRRGRRRPRRPRPMAISRAARLTWRWSGLTSRSHALRQRRDAPELRSPCRSRRRRRPPRRPCTASPRTRGRRRSSGERRRPRPRRAARHGLRLAGQRRHVELERRRRAAARRPTGGRPPASSSTSPGTSSRGVDGHRLRRRAGRGLARGRNSRKRLGGALGLQLLQRTRRRR